MSDNVTMIDNSNKLRGLTTEQLDSVRASVSEDGQLATLLCSLLDSYGDLIVALELRAEYLSLAGMAE